MNNPALVEKELLAPVCEEGTGLPCFKTWRATYIFTLASFAAWVVLLFALTEFFS